MARTGLMYFLLIRGDSGITAPEIESLLTERDERLSCSSGKMKRPINLRPFGVCLRPGL